MVKVHMLPAAEGDFFWVEYGNDESYSHILVDGGVDETGNTFAKIISEIDSRDESIEAIILTHIDYDHIQGVIKGLEQISKKVLEKVVKSIIFNTSKGIRNKGITTRANIDNWEDSIKVNRSSKGYGVGEAISLIELLKDKGLADRLIDYVVAGNIITTKSEAQLKVISPNQDALEELLTKWENYGETGRAEGYASNLELTSKSLYELEDERLYSDSSVNNKSSIAFIFEFDDNKVAFLGDSLPSICIKGLRELDVSIPYKVDAVKISHHGSRSNTSDKLLKVLPTENYLISTNGKGRKVPSKVVISHIWKCLNKKKAKVFCNYEWWENEYNGKYFTDDDKEKMSVDKMTAEKSSIEFIHLKKHGSEASKGMVFYGRYKAN